MAFVMKANGKPSIVVLPYEDLHLKPAVEALLHVRVADPGYPPPQDVPATVDAFTAWLLSEETIGRWIAEADGLPAGHISITEPHSYLTNALSEIGCSPQAPGGFCEVSKFFTEPIYQGLGIGSALFDHALTEARIKGYQPALAVIDTSYAARRFYGAKGLREAGSFNGVHGVNYVFVDEQQPHR